MTRELAMIKMYSNTYPMAVIYVDETAYIEFKRLFCVIFGLATIPNVTKELECVSENNYLITGAGRGRTTFISGDGMTELLSKTIRLSYREKIAVIENLKQVGLTFSVGISNSRKELDFFDCVCDFFSYFNFEVKRQITINGAPYIYDMLIGLVIVEFDENSHSSYNKESEKIREDYALSNGYRFLRVTDSDSISTNLARIAKEVL